jgi:hypothetical protein
MFLDRNALHPIVCDVFHPNLAIFIHFLETLGIGLAFLSIFNMLPHFLGAIWL